jgi:hypothetical protein
MEETPAKQGYIFSPDNPIYHLALNDRLTLCGLWVFGEPDQRRRKDDRRLVAEKPAGQFVALCSQCERIASGTAQPERPSVELLSSSRFADIIA